jgi:reductive dehalogenase
MSKHHSTVSRRDFLKLLGLGGVGLGTAAVSAPVFHDLDELMASPGADGKKAWYAREVDNPTCEINWSIMERWSRRESMWAEGLRKALGPEQLAQVYQTAAENTRQRILDNKPGCTLKDVALSGAHHWAPVSFVGPQTSPRPEDLGVPRWEGTPEENAQIVRAFLRLHGAYHVGFVELDTNTTEKLIYSHDSGPGYPRLDILDVDEPYEDLEADETYRVIPKKARWVIVYSLRMSDESMRRAPTEVASRTTYAMYNLRTLLQGQLQNFLRTLGYMGLGEVDNFNSLGTATGFAVLAGLGELARMGHTITPEFGLRQRIWKLITDLPLAPGKPVDFGAMRFCKTCKKCAQHCPAQAISHDTEPSWETHGKPYLHSGVRNWFLTQDACNVYMLQNSSCSVCFAVCPLSKGGHKAFYHDLQRWTIANTSLFDGFFTRMDGFLDYGLKTDPKEIEGWWDLDLPPWGWTD